MAYVFLSDFVRFYCVIVALWLIAVLLRLTYRRVVRYPHPRRLLRRQESPHPLTTLGLAGLLFASILRRFDALGEPGDRYLWIVFVTTNLILLGVLINVRFTFKPPWRRH